MTKNIEANYQQLNSDNPLLDLKTYYIQKVIENNLTLFRAYTNGYYWIKNKYNDIENRNLGYYSPLQTNLSNYFRSLIIDWLNDPVNAKNIRHDLEKYFDIKKKESKNVVNDFVIKLAKDIDVTTNCVIELHILSIINKIPIVVYNDYNDLTYIFDNGLVMGSLSQKFNNKDIINLRFSYFTNRKIPDDIETLYYK
jgi:hypothetical protein